MPPKDEKLPLDIFMHIFTSTGVLVSFGAVLVAVVLYVMRFEKSSLIIGLVGMVTFVLTISIATVVWFVHQQSLVQ